MTLEPLCCLKLPAGFGRLRLSWPMWRQCKESSAPTDRTTGECSSPGVNAVSVDWHCAVCNKS